MGRWQEESLTSCCGNRVHHATLIKKPAQLDVIRKKHPVCGFYFQRERESWNICPIFQISRALPEGLVSVLPDWVCWYNWWTLDACDIKESSVVPCCTEEHSEHQSPETARDYKLLKKKPANLSNREVTPTSPEGHIPKQGLKGSRNLLPGWLMKVFPCMMPFHKDWERWLILQMHKLQQYNNKAHKEIRKHGPTEGMK